MYLQKFDVDNSDGKMYWHQYMQNILAAQSEGTTLRKTLNNIGAIDYGYTFIIPVYENMPTNTSSRPSTTSAPKQVDVDLVKVNANPSIRMRNEPNGNSTKGALYLGEIATRLQSATSKVGNTYWDKILKNDGTVGYVARTTYDYESNYKEYLISVGGSGNSGGSGDSGNNNQNDGTEVKKGDVNGDGEITTRDAQYIQEYVVGKRTFNENQKKVADVNGDGEITTRDAQYIQEYVVGKRNF